MTDPQRDLEADNARLHAALEDARKHRRLNFANFKAQAVDNVRLRAALGEVFRLTDSGSRPARFIIDFFDGAVPSASTPAPVADGPLAHMHITNEQLRRLQEPWTDADIERLAADIAATPSDNVTRASSLERWSEREGPVLYECTCETTLRPGEPEQRERNPTCPEHGTERDIQAAAGTAATSPELPDGYSVMHVQSGHGPADTWQPLFQMQMPLRWADTRAGAVATCWAHASAPSRIDVMTQECVRLRKRTHEIAEAKDAEHRATVRELEKLKRWCTDAKAYADKHLKTDGAFPAWWQSTCEANRMALAALLAELNELRGQAGDGAARPKVECVPAAELRWIATELAMEDKTHSGTVHESKVRRLHRIADVIDADKGEEEEPPCPKCEQDRIEGEAVERILENPPAPTEALRQLMSEPSVLERGWINAKHKCAWCGSQMLVRLSDRKQRCPNDCASGLGACPEKFLPDGAAPDEGHRREFDPNTGAPYADPSTYTLTYLPPAAPSRQSPFNAEQQEHMADLARIPAAQRCWCGWYRLGECPHCPADRTAEEKLARKQPCCGFTPPRPDEPDGHYVGCKRETSK